MSILGHNAACCTIPPATPQEYIPRGVYEEINGLKTYVTGPARSKKAILVVYDIFGFFPQTIEGADILAYSDPDHEYQVFMPDFFHGEPADIAWYPPETDSQKASLYSWFATRTPQTYIPLISPLLSAIETLHGPKTSWGGVGLCWGGKLITLLSSADSPFTATCQAHPGLIDAADAARVAVPVCMVASGEEDEGEVRAWEAALAGAVERRVEVWEGTVHGFMSARGEVGRGEVRREFERGYAVFGEWFARWL